MISLARLYFARDLSSEKEGMHRSRLAVRKEEEKENNQQGIHSYLYALLNF
jgi:hypothetical protein